MNTLDDTLGAFLIGVIAAAVLYGVTFLQTWYYFTRYPSDPWYLKLLVFAVFISDSTHQALITHSLYTFLISDFGNSQGTEKILWSLIVALFFTGLSAVMVQSFLFTRIYRLSKKTRLFTAISALLLVLGEFVVQLLYTTKALSTSVPNAELKNLSTTVNAFATAVDLIIAASLCTLIQQTRTGFRRTNTITKRMMMFTINTGLLTSIFASMALISIIAWPEAYINNTFYFCVGRLYCNTLLATLNARQGIEDAVDISVSLHGSGSPVTPSQRNNIPIKINTQRDYDTDEELQFKDLREYSPASDI